MGPGCFHPRNEMMDGLPFVMVTLQWGRDVSIPEIRDLLPVAAPVVELQWGRDVSIPEMLDSSDMTHIHPAASMGPGCFHPRNSNSTSVTSQLSGSLQWGRDVSIPEISLPEAASSPVQ